MIAQAQLIENRSGIACIANSTWGVLADRVWVNGGCAGTFQIWYQY